MNMEEVSNFVSGLGKGLCEFSYFFLEYLNPLSEWILIHWYINVIFLIIISVIVALEKTLKESAQRPLFILGVSIFIPVLISLLILILECLFALIFLIGNLLQHLRINWVS